jgi:hypothetical protein
VEGEDVTLDDILRTAQGGKAIDNLAVRFDLTQGQAQAGAQAMIPAFAAALRNMSANPAALSGFLTEMASGAHAAAYADSSAATGASSGAAASAAGPLAHVFDSREAIGKAVDEVAQASGVSRETIDQMMPAVASLLTGGLAHSLAAQGHGEVLSKLASGAAGPNGLGSAVADASAGSGGFMGSLMSSLFGGSRTPANPQHAALVAGLTALSAMFVAGAAATQAQQAGLGAMAQSGQPPPPV